MESVSPVQILDYAVCVSLHANAFQKGMNPSVLLPIMRKLCRLSFLAFQWKPILEKEKVEFKSALLSSKNPVSNPARSGGVGKYIQSVLSMYQKYFHFFPKDLKVEILFHVYI